jgi:hypothetical protein
MMQFFVVGMFIAELLFGIIFYGLQRGLAKALVRVVSGPSPGVAAGISGLGVVLMIVQVVVVYLAAREVFRVLEGVG